MQIEKESVTDPLVNSLKFIRYSAGTVYIMIITPAFFKFWNQWRKQTWERSLLSERAFGITARNKQSEIRSIVETNALLLSTSRDKGSVWLISPLQNSCSLSSDLSTLASSRSNALNGLR